VNAASAVFMGRFIEDERGDSEEISRKGKCASLFLFYG
jgi:hypothetical protein